MKASYLAGGQVYTLVVEPAPEGYVAEIDGQKHEVTLVQAGPGHFTLNHNGRAVQVHWAVDGPLRWVAVDGRTFVLDKRASLSGRGPGEMGEDDVLRSPMPGQVRAVEVGEGDQVDQGQTLILLEAMKMEIRIQAPCPGRVARLAVEEGQSVEREQVLVELTYQEG